MKDIFVNRFNELRAGWKILAFFILATGFVFALTGPLRFVVSSMPAWFPGVVAPVLALGGVLIASYITTKWLNRKPFAAVGLWIHNGAMRECGWGVLIGFLMMGGIFFLLLLAGYVDVEFREVDLSATLGIILTSAIMFAAGAMLEEVAFRGYPFQILIQGITLLPALLLMDICFSAAHIGNPNTTMFGFVNIALASIWLSFAYLKTMRLWFPFGLHFGWNFSQTTIFSFPTSGIEFSEYKLFGTVVSGPEWLTGGAFGPEGGALSTVMIVASTVYILKTGRFEPIPGIVTLDSIEDLPPIPVPKQEAIA